MNMLRSVSLLAFVCAALSASAVTITFDEFGSAPRSFVDTTPLRDEYAALGVFFSGPDANGGGAIVSASTFPIDARSGSNILAFNTVVSGVFPGNGSAIGPETITFGSLQSAVSLYYAQSGLTLAAFDAAGNLVATSVGGATDSFALLSVSGAGIKSVTLAFAGNVLMVDDLSFTASAVPGPAAALPFALMALRRRKRS